MLGEYIHCILNEMKTDPATMQAAAGFPLIGDIDTSFIFSDSETAVLRQLAQKVAAIAALDIEINKAERWTKHNDLQDGLPMVSIDPENGCNEIIPASELRGEDPLARVWEIFLRKQIYWAEGMKDDKVLSLILMYRFVLLIQVGA